MSEKKYPLKRGQEYEFYIQKLAFGGAGLARVDNYVVFIKGTIPGDRVIARVFKRKTAFAEARLIRILEPSQQRITPPCRYFGWCGGCNWQTLSYQDQLMYKRQIVAESLSHLGGIGELEIKPVVVSDSIFAYRNKMEFSFSDRRWLLPEELANSEIKNDFALGLHIPGTFDKILQIDECLLQSSIANQILLFVKDYSVAKGLPPYGIKSHQGLLRFLVIRQSRYNDSILVNIVTAYEDRKVLTALADELVKRFPDIKSVVNTINSGLAQVAYGDKEFLLAGVDHIQEKLGNYIFKISANSFFQTNTTQALKLYQLVKEFAALSGREIVWDLYSGTGTIALFVANDSKQVLAFESNESAVSDGKNNAREHHISNVQFIAGDLLHHLEVTHPQPDVLITDPPRAGMHPRVTEYIHQLKAKRVVYVSCNPTTLARDLALLKNNYHITAVQPVDMFPQTYHIETIVQLTLKEGSD
jgi:23S rRNA (uracil1939-C5)-methyltransferase